ncbi:MAG: hypothetical protein IKO40_04505 [Kiritimatiellae bacterium]|nr:hypothetical protein [Kiritimatiellia bacterium]
MTDIAGTVSAKTIFIWTSVIITIVGWVLILFGTPVAVRRMPADFFTNPAYLAPKGRGGRPWPLFIALVALRNLAGVALVILGTVFLQGFIAVMMGLAIMDIPRKAAGVRRIASIPFVWRILSRIRERAALPPLEHP